MRQRAFFFLVCALTLAGCGGSEQYGNGYPSGPATPTPLEPNLPAGNGTRHTAAILLPMTGPRADIGQILLQAAQLALADNTGPELDVLDTQGTPAGAAAAAQTAIANRDSLILGPLTSGETAAVAPIAKGAGVPVLAFTNDPAQSQPGVWPLGITPNQQVRRLVASAVAQGKSQFAALLPDSDFGHAMVVALNAATQDANLPAPTIRMHSDGMPAITEAVRDLSDYADRRGPLDAKVRAARAEGTIEGRREAAELVKTTPIPPPPFNVLLLADTGEALQEVAAMLPYYDVSQSDVQFIGPAIWADPATSSASVMGAWYAAPDNNARTAFVNDYTGKYGVPPPAVSDLAFDAASIAKVLVGPRGADLSILTQPGGFVGSDGWFALQPDGHIQRGLAVFRLERGGPQMIDPAPQSAGSPGL